MPSALKHVVPHKFVEKHNARGNIWGILWYEVRHAW